MSGRNYSVPYPHHFPKKTNGKPFKPKKYTYNYHGQETIYKNEWRVENYYPFYITQLEDYLAMFQSTQGTKITVNSIYGGYQYKPLYMLHSYQNKLAHEISVIQSAETHKTLESAEVEQKEKLVEHYQTKISNLHKNQFKEIEKFNKIIKIIENEIAEYIEKCPEKLV